MNGRRRKSIERKVRQHQESLIYMSWRETMQRPWWERWKLALRLLVGG